MSAKVTVDDLRWLRSQLPALAEHGDTLQVERLEDWLDMCVGVRLAQKTKSKTRWHADLMLAYEAAVIRWQQECENECSDYTAEIREYRERHPMPRLKDFMRAARTGSPNVCPLCGSPLDETTEEEA